MISGKFLAAAALIVASGGCTLLPTSGPSATTVANAGAQDQDLQKYLFVPLNGSVIAALAHFQPPTFESRFATVKPPPVQRIGVGDVLTVVLFEAGQGSLFPSQNGARVQLTLQVDNAGNISIPYAGLIHAEGLAPRALERTIVKDLQGKAVEPQASVVISTPVSSTVQVGGDVKKPGPLPLSPAGTHILDALNEAGGSAGQTYETRIRLVRHGRTGEIMMQDLIDRPGDNVYLQPRDQLFVIREPLTYLVFGAVNRPGTDTFTHRQMSLAEALAKTGGLQPALAQGSVFLFRYEPEDVAKAIKPDYDGKFGPLVPVVYRLDMRDPNAFFLARQMQMKDKDIIYLSPAASVDLLKFLAIVNAIGGTAQQGAVVTYNIQRAGR
ncbi:MAG TPA: polysaccharide biosynthesis/export family protein [Hyphomicrobiales bacterium]|nr:polysaccharide biosynthesis/export family protein [Hyphomicrobiales bacterium]